MAEAILSPVINSILQKASSLTWDFIAEEITVAKNDINTIAEKLEAIRVVIQEIEEKQYSNNSIKIWVRDLKNVVYDIDDILDEVAYDTLLQSIKKGKLFPKIKYFLSSSNPFISSFYLSHKIRDLKEKLAKIVAKKNEFGLTEHLSENRAINRDVSDECAYLNSKEIVGRDEAKKNIISRILSVGNATMTYSDISVLPIFGMGGIGKTKLAKLVYHDVDFFDVKLWVHVSDKFNVRKIVEDMVKNVTDEDTSMLSLNRLVGKLKELLDEKRYLLVLDDVWVEEFSTWLELKGLIPNGNHGSVILVTTRHEKVASITQTIDHCLLDRLSDDVCWTIFKKFAFRTDEEQMYPQLVQIGRSIVAKCGGVPLLVQSLGSLLRTERDQGKWQRVHDVNSFSNLEGDYVKVLQLLKLSYDKLPSHLKACFAYCSLLVKDVPVGPIYMSYTWSALGLLQPEDSAVETENCGYGCYTELLSRSLLQDPTLIFNGTVKMCKMHDLLHDLAMNILGEELALVTYDELKFSEFSRHLVWGYERPNGLSDKEFPKKLLSVRNIRTFRFGYQVNRISQSILEGIISNFSCLRILDLGSAWFEQLPRLIGDMKHLRYLNLSNNPLITSLPDTICKLLNLQTLRLNDCHQLKELPKNIHRLLSLRHFVVTTCQASLVDTRFNGLSSLRRLGFYSCKGLVSLWNNVDIGCLTSLRILHIIDCQKLTCLPDSMTHLVCLETLVISGCQELDLEKGEAMSCLQNLRSLQIKGVPRLTYLPQGIQSAATSLQYLLINDCRALVELSDRFQCLTSLRRLFIYNCTNLISLPEGFHHLKSLKQLHISNCSYLTQTCAFPDGEDCSKIQHVPEIWLDNHVYAQQNP